MIQGRCPICSRSFTVATIDDLPSFPFCSDRCRRIDLGRWLDGAYVIPGPSAGNQQPLGPRSSTDQDEDGDPS